jgi:uncharacterized protein
MNRLNLSFKFAKGAEDGTFAGYGAVFGNVDSYGDVIAKGAFKDTLKEAAKTGTWPAMLLQHGGGMFGGSAEDMMPVGIWTSLTEDDTGLKAEGKLALDTRRGAETYALMKMEPRPAINGLSIGYRAKKFTMGTKAGEPRRTLEAVDLFECSIVTFPANGKALIDSVKGGMPTEREFEDWLVRDAGFSRKEAKVIIADGFKTLGSMRDAAESGSDLVEVINRATQSLRA